MKTRIEIMSYKQNRDICILTGMLELSFPPPIKTPFWKFLG